MLRLPLTLLLLVLLGAAVAATAATAAPAPSTSSKGAAAADEVTLVSHLVSGVTAAQEHYPELDGRGVSIAFTDTGINYRHPAFGPCDSIGQQGSKCRVLGGMDLVGDAEPGDLIGGLTSFQPDNNPMECSMNATHGTQVASIAAGDSSYHPDRPWRGVAYAADILAYKVTTGCKYRAGTVSTTATLQALKRAIQNKADVINLSWGDFRGGGYPNSNFTSVLTSAMQQGALVSMAAGNDGIMGPFFTEAGIAVPDVLSVASVDVWVNFTEVSLRLDVPVTVGGKTRTNTLAAFGPTLSPSVDMLAVDKVAKRLAALPLPANIVPVEPATACGPLKTPAALLKGQIALVRRGECTFDEKVEAAAAAGAAEVLVYQGDAAAGQEQQQFLQMNLQEVPEIPIWGLQLSDSRALLAAVKAAAAASGAAGRKKPQQQQPKFVRVLSAKTSGTGAYELAVVPSSFSSWGPSVTLDMLPSISAPGSSVIAASGLNGYTEVEGTSFAAPYVSGALALWRQAHKGREPPAITAYKLQQQQATAKSGGSSSGSSVAAGAAKAAVGAGRGGGADRQPLRVEMTKKPAAAAPPTGSAAQRRPLQAASAAAKPPAVVSKRPPTQQQAAYAAFVSTAHPVDWRASLLTPGIKEGWAQPVARVGAGLMQVDAAISNPTVITPTHLLLRSNQASQTLSVTVTNTAPFSISYKLGHKPAAAITTKGLWFVGDQEDLLAQLAATVEIKQAGRVVDSLSLAPRRSATLEVTLKTSPELRAKPYVYSGYITLTPLATDSSKAQQAVPLVVPYQGFSQNYTTQPILPPQDVSKYPKEIQDIKGLLHVCYASHDLRGAFDPTASLADSGIRATSGASGASNDLAAQDGTLGRKQVTQCQHTSAHDRDVTQLFLDPISKGKGVVMASVALKRPALRMSLVLFETDDCSGSGSSNGRPAGAAASKLSGTAAAAAGKVVQESGGSGRRLLLGQQQQQQQQQQQKPLPARCKPGSSVGAYKQYVGEVWRYETPSRDYPGSLWAYYNDAFRGNVTVRDTRTDAVVGSKAVQRKRMYRLQLWVWAPLAAADRPTEQYKTWKFDIRGGFEFV